MKRVRGANAGKNSLVPKLKRVAGAGAENHNDNADNNILHGLGSRPMQDIDYSLQLLSQLNSYAPLGLANTSAN